MKDIFKKKSVTPVNQDPISAESTDWEDPEDEDWDAWDDEWDELEEYTEEEYEFNPQPHRDFLRVSNLCDGCKSFAEIADALRNYADFADSMHDEGQKLVAPVRDGFAYFYQEDANA